MAWVEFSFYCSPSAGHELAERFESSTGGGCIRSHVRVSPADGGVAIVGSSNAEDAAVRTRLEVEDFGAVRHLVSVATVRLADAAAQIVYR